MGEALLQIAEESECRIGNAVLEKIKNFWVDGMETRIAQETAAISAEEGITVENKGILAGILNLFVKIKTDLKFNEETRKEYRQKISVRSSEWIGILGHIADEIAKKTGGKRPIIIFEDLDKSIRRMHGKYFTIMRQSYQECGFQWYTRSRSGFLTMCGFQRWRAILLPRHCQ